MSEVPFESLRGELGEAGGVGSILRLLGSEDNASRGLEEVAMLSALWLLSLIDRINRLLSEGTRGNLRRIFGLTDGEFRERRELVPGVEVFKDSS